MKRLSSDVKAYIVQRLACFDYLRDVVEGVKKEFDIEITRQHAEGHDPTKSAGKNLAKKWKALFEQTREQFLEDTSEIAISHKSVRLRMLERMARKAEEMNNMVLAASLAEQAAKEMGGAFTNRRELSAPGGEPLSTVVILPAKNAEG